MNRATAFLTTILWLAMMGCATQQTPSQRPASIPSGGARTADNSRTSLDWAGTYQGFLPCGDCEGVDLMLTLNKDQTYVLQRRYVGKDADFSRSTGTFTWDATGNQITIPEKEPIQYIVGETKLTQLDRYGQRMSGKLVGRYELAKTPAGLTDRRWKLIELNGQPVAANAEGKEAFLTLRAESNQVVGNGGCNNLMGGFQLLTGNRIRFAQMASTKMACADVDTEQRFTKALETVDTYTINGDVLSLSQGKTAPMARFQAMQ